MKTAIDPFEVEMKKVQNDTEELKVWRLNLNQELDDLEKDQKKLKSESEDIKKIKDDLDEFKDWRINLIDEIDELEKDQKSFIDKWESKMPCAYNPKVISYKNSSFCMVIVYYV